MKTLTPDQPVTALTYYVCRNYGRCVQAPPHPGITEIAHARQLRESIATGRPLHPPAAICDCGQRRSRLADTARLESAEKGLGKIREYVDLLSAGREHNLGTVERRVL